MNKIIFTIVLIAAAGVTILAQTRTTYSDMMMKRCPESKAFYSSYVLQTTGDTMTTPCPGKSNIFNNSLVVRKNSADYYPYSDTFDILNEYSTTEEYGRNMGVNFNINSTPFSYSSSYMNAAYYTIYNSPNRAGGVIGLFSNSTLMSNTPIHDIQGIHGEATAINGSAASGLYGGIFNVGLFGGTNHGNIADLTVGASSVRDTDVRNYYRLWIKKPTILNATIRDGKNYSIYQEGQFGSEFQGYLFLNNAHANSSGAAVTPLQIKLASAQTAEALTVSDANSVPLFSLTPGGQIRIVNPATPSSSSAACASGTISWDVNYVYVCVASNNWRRTALESF